MWKLRSIKSLLIAAALVLLSGPFMRALAVPIGTINVNLLNTTFVAGVTTNTTPVIFINTSGPGPGFAVPDAGEVVNLQLLDSGVVVPNGMFPSSFTTTGTGQINGGNSPFPITFYKASSNLQIRAISTVNTITGTSAIFEVIPSSNTRLVVVGPGMDIDDEWVYPPLSSILTGSFTPQEANTPFSITVSHFDYLNNPVQSNDTVTFQSASSGVSISPSTGPLSSGTAQFTVTMTEQRVTHTLTALDTTNTTVSNGTLEITTAGPPAKEIFPFPSPFNPQQQDITFRFRLGEPHSARMIVTDLFGQPVWETSVSGTTGFNDVTWNGRNDKGSIVASGVYYVLMEIDGSLESKKRFGVKK